MNASTDSALNGIRVIDFGHYIAGPLAALLLAEQGAEVIHIDRPDSTTGALNPSARDDAFLNRSKQRLTLDLKNPHDLQQARALIATADIVIENFRPGVMQRLGLDLHNLRTTSSRLITCSLPGFAADDPRAPIQAWEGIVCSAAGLYNAISPAGELPADRTPYNDLPLASNFAAFQAATAIVMALIARNKTGKGQHIEAPLFDCAMELLGPAVPDSFPNYTIIYGGGIYACAQGHVFFNANNPRFLFWLLDAVGISAELRTAGLLDNECINGKDQVRNRLLRDRLATLFLTRRAAEWEDFAAEHYIPLARMRTLQEWQTTEAAHVAGAVTTVQDPQLGALDQPGQVIDLSISKPAIQHPRHLPDQDRNRLQALLATRASTSTSTSTSTSAAIQRNGDTQQALAGVRILDLANIVAGPSVGRWLADFGAEVIKINDPNSLSVAMHDYLNRGKKSALINANSPQGRDAILKLSACSDVFLANFPKSTAQRYGYDEASVRTHRSDIIYASISCYGATGPWRDRRGYEPQAQAAAGIMSHYGHADHPVMLPYLVNDYGTGVLGAFAVGLALLHRQQTGAGQRAEASLAQTATFHQWGHVPETWHQHLYQTADGWIFIGQAAQNTTALRELFNLATGLSETTLTQQIAAAIHKDSTQAWADRCAARGINAMPLATQRAAMQHAYASQRGVTHAARPRLSGTLEHPGVTVHLSLTPKIHGKVPEAAGADLEEVFAIGAMRDALPALLAQGIVRHQLAKPSIAPPGKDSAA